MDDKDLAALVRRVQAGEEAAFDELVATVGRSVYNLAYRLCGHRESAADLTQEVFVKLYRRIGRFEWRSKFTTWLYALAVNTCRSGMRRMRRVAYHEPLASDGGGEEPPGGQCLDAADPAEGPDQRLLREELAQDIQRAMAELPRAFREVVVMRDVQGLSYEEIAAVLGVGLGTVKSRLARGRLRLKERLAPLLNQQGR